MTALVVVAVILLALIGAPIFAVMGAFGALGAHSVAPGSPLSDSMAGQLVDVFALATSEKGNSLAVIPLFTFMGYILAESQTASRLVRVAKAWVGWFPGGLAIVTIFVCALFTTVTGASGVTIVAVGGLVFPALIKEGYKERFSLGLITSTGSIGLLFPPALPLIIYGIIYGISAQANASSAGDTMLLIDFDLSRFLLAGIVPGLLLTGSFGLYAVFIALRDRVPRTGFDLGEALKSLVIALPELLIPGLMVTLMFIGLQIPEAAAFTCLYVVLLETLIYRDVNVRMFPHLVRESMRLVGAIFILIFAATALTNFFVSAHIPDRMTDWLVSTFHSKVTFLLMLNLILLAVGSVMDIFSALLVVVPLIAPAATGFGIDPYHLGVIFLLNLEIGFVHPPVGLNLFIASFRFRKPMNELYLAVLPFLAIMVVVLLVVTYVDWLTPIKSKGMKGPARETPTQPVAGAGASDAGPSVQITFPDGGVWTIATCERPEIKDDPLGYEECKLKFKLYPKCDTLDNELDKLDCRQAVIEGKDPFAADAAP